MEKLCVKHFEIPVEGLRRTYRFAHITDAHLLLYDETETPARAAYAEPRVGLFSENGIRSEQRFEMLMQYVREHAQELDAVIMTGDILDFPSALNLKYLHEQIGKLSVPVMYVLGNHDWAYFDDYHTEASVQNEKPKFTDLCGGDTAVQVMRFGELTLIGVDNSDEKFEDGCAERLEALLKEEKNVLLCMHIPLYAETLHEDTVAYWWGQDITVGGEGICKNENHRQVRQLAAAPGTPVRAVITGHLHFWHQDMLDGMTPQYVTALAASGNMAVFTVCPKE